MKLFTRYFRINLIATLSIFLLAGIAFYYVLWFLMIRQVDEDLRIEQREIETYAAKYQRPPEPVNVKDQRISFEISPNSERLHRFSTIQSPDRNERENFRQLSFTLPVGGQWILFKVSKSLEAAKAMSAGKRISLARSANICCEQSRERERARPPSYGLSLVR